MSMLILGLALFLGTHSLRIFAEDWRRRKIAELGLGPWKGLYSIASLAGFALVVWGYGMGRATAPEFWSPPLWTRHVAALLLLPSFVLVAAAYVPGTRIKARLHHPMVLGTKLWAFAHLLANGRSSDLVLFGAILAWAVLDFRSARQRDRQEGTVYPPGRASRDAMAVVAGAALWGVFGWLLHGWLIGVQPFG